MGQESLPTFPVATSSSLLRTHMVLKTSPELLGSIAGDGERPLAIQPINDIFLLASKAVPVAS